MHRRVRALLALAVVAAGAVACGSKPPTPAATVATYLKAWGASDDAAMRAVTESPPVGFTATNEVVSHALHATRTSYVAGPLTTTGSQATAPITATLTVPGFDPVVIRTTLALHLAGGHWRVVWTPATVAPGLAVGDKITVVTAWPSRAPVLGAAGTVLTPSTQTVTVGVTGSRLKDPAAVSAAMIAAGLPAAAVHAAITAAAATPAAFQTVATISQDQYAGIAGRLYPLPGTSFLATDKQATITADLAAHTVGAVLPITADQLKALGAPYSATDSVGRGGLESADEHRLAGRPSLTAVAVTPAGVVGPMIASEAAVPGQAVQTTIDPTVQRAAEAAMNGTAQAAAMVVIQPSTGNILGVVSRPVASGFDLAFTGSVPPGSTFKVITTTAALASGVTAATPLTCPPTITVDGRTFHNDEGEAAPTLTFAQAFAVSCNTAFIGVGQHLAGSALVAAAHQYGLGQTLHIGLPAYGGSVPAPTDGASLAATSIGQGQTTVSPLAMAVVAATAATGTLRAPVLVSGSAAAAAPAMMVPPATLATLHQFMAGVTTGSGTAAGAGLPAGTFGKTGTAEYGTGTSPPTHAWFIGFRGDLAFAVYVDNGVGGQVAAPLAAALLKGLPSS